jgi:hypothetical protein
LNVNEVMEEVTAARTKSPYPLSWHVIAGSDIGIAHRRRGGVNEDAHLSASRCDHTLLLTAADGAGFARFAAQASQRAVERTIELLGEVRLPSDAQSWPSLLHEVVASVRSSLLEATVAAAMNAPSQTVGKHAFATTLLVTVLTRRWLAALQLGDGAIVARFKNGELRRITKAFHGEHAGETVFVTSDTYREHVSIAVLPTDQLSGVALLTDGLEPLATMGSDQAPFAPFFNPLFDFAANQNDPHKKSQELTSFLMSERINARTHDDKTLLLAVPA